MLKQAREAILRTVTRISIHDQPYFDVTYSPVDEQDRAYQARIGIENVYPDPAPGDRVAVHTMMNVVTRIDPSGDQDA